MATNGHANGHAAPTGRKLNVHQRHYIIKALCCLEMQQEWAQLEKLGALTDYGYPFALERPKLKRLKQEMDQLEKDYISKGNKDDDDTGAGAGEVNDEIYESDAAMKRAEGITPPVILRHLFHTQLHTFPGLNQAPLKYWQDRWQIILDEMAARNFSHSSERGEISRRHFFLLAATRYLGGYVARGMGVRGEGELRGPGPGEPGTERWGQGKQWGAGTVKRGMAKPIRPDARLTAKIDNLFEGQEKEVWQRAAKEAQRVRGDWRAWKEDIIENETGLEKTLNHLEIANMKNLPGGFRNATEYARNFAASMIYYLMVTGPGSDDIFFIIKTIHLLFPYWGAKELLRVANAQKMIALFLNLLLARPLGAPSLLQRILGAIIGGQAKAFEKNLIVPLRKSINNPNIIQAIDAYVKKGSRIESRSVRLESEKTGNDVLTVVLLRSNAFSERDVLEMQTAYANSPLIADLNAAYPSDCKLEEGERRDPPHLTAPDSHLALTFARAKLYLRNALKKRDRQQASAMANGSLIPTVIKDTLSQVFYPSIREIAHHANLATRLGDLEAFNKDMIKLRSSGDKRFESWVALAARHEQSLYMLFHECASIAQPLFDWFQIGADYMALSTSDPCRPANDNAKRFEVNVEKLIEESNLTDEEFEGMISEIDRLSTYILWQKIWYDLELRKMYLFAHPEAAPASGLSSRDIPTQSMKDRVSNVDELLKELMISEGVEIEDGTCDNPTRGTETADYPWAWFDLPDFVGQKATRQHQKQPPKFAPKVLSAKIPALDYTRKLLPAFVNTISQQTPDWKAGIENKPGVCGPTSSAAAGSASVLASDRQSSFHAPAAEEKKKKFKLFGKKK
ncbi:hypothetical protein OC846_006247 [Tilletia horrida]|uniref:DUF3818 domain-containing protein n=1 Tax=Tilletia horrida TaxID=155126 RepID=A0AAN6GM01_9BASI|nr:hypothetical protein OC846_006247 [Tilletia horrida]KAK0560201.1 hypothetical protein OC861_006366 [Tilletia horrida]